MKRIKITKQVIVSKDGHSWLGFYSLNQKLNKALDEICVITQQKNYREGSLTNAFWILDLDGGCVAAQSSLEGALRYYNENRILVHHQRFFI